MGKRGKPNIRLFSSHAERLRVERRLKALMREGSNCSDTELKRILGLDHAMTTTVIRWRVRLLGPLTAKQKRGRLDRRKARMLERAGKYGG